MLERTMDFSTIKRPEPKHPFDPAVYRLLEEDYWKEDERAFGATMGVSAESKALLQVVQARKNYINFLIRKGVNRERAIEIASDELRTKITKYLGTDADLVLFYEVYPI